MADSRTVTGGMDDLAVDASRCLRMRYSESGCRRCVEICPHGAVALDGGLAISRELCRGCLLCTGVCPVGALEQNSDFSACLTQLSRAPEPVLGCIRTGERANGTMACLGGLSEEHLLALCHTLSGTLALNLSLCCDCPNNTMIPRLRQRLALLSASGLPEGGCLIVIAETAQQIHFLDESVDRRGFFKSFRNSLFKSAAVMLSPANEAERRSDYAVKRLPARRELLNRTVARLPVEAGIQIRGRYDRHIAISDSCTVCQGCVAICPTGALLTDFPDERPRFDTERCTGCGLCVEFCLDDALSPGITELCF
jgi:ferredoxin